MMVTGFLVMYLLFKYDDFIANFGYLMLEFERNHSNKNPEFIKFQGINSNNSNKPPPYRKKKNVLFHHQINLPRPTQTSKVMVS